MFKIEEKGSEKMVITTQPITKGTVVCLFKGKPMDYEQTLQMGNKESFAFQVGPKEYIFLDSPARFFNHCCEPNCGVNTNRELVSLEDIDINEELRWDYSTSMLEHHWTMKCNCKKPSCRWVVKDFIYLPFYLQKKYLEQQIVQPFIIKALKK